MSEFDSVEEYITYLKEDVSVSQKEIEQMTDGERVAYMILGMAVEAGAIGEKLGVTVDADFTMMLAKVVDVGKDAVFGIREVIHVIQGLKEEGITDLKDVASVFTGEGGKDRIWLGETFERVLSAVSPGNEDKIMDAVENEAREVW